MPLTLTVKQTEGPLPSRVLRTIPRQTLWALQTPQVFRRSTLLEAIARCPVPLAQVTDDLQLIELAGGATFLIPGEERNLKLTTAGDLSLAELLLKQGEA
jgi:2-C-methyl-D-erythritol 4-phosphate cytidylyltransferase